MKIRVISGSVIHDKKLVEVNGIINDIDAENAKRLCEDGFCELLEELPLADAEETTVDESTDADVEENTETEGNLEELTKKELLEYAAQIGVEVDERDKKAVIIEKIYAFLSDEPITEMP